MIGEDYFSWRENVEQHFQVLTAAPQLKGLLQDYIQSLGFDFFAFLSSIAFLLRVREFICMILTPKRGLNVIRNGIIMPLTPCCSAACVLERGGMDT